MEYLSKDDLRSVQLIDWFILLAFFPRNRRNQTRVRVFIGEAVTNHVRSKRDDLLFCGYVM